MVQKILGAQRDFSFGQVDVSLKRQDDHPARKAGLRQMVNARILNATSIQNRSGRTALFPITNSCARIEEFTISVGKTFKIAFGPSRIQIINSVGAVVQQFTTQGNGAALPWTAFNLNSIVYAIFNTSIYIAFAGMRPQVVAFDGVSTWAISDYAELLAGNQKRTTFYRISPQGITIAPSATTGSVTVVASSPVFSAALVGTRIRYVSRQLLITAFTDSTHVTATVEETLPGSQTIQFTSNPALFFSIGDQVIGATSNSKGIVITLNGSPNTMQVQLLTNDTVVLPNGSPAGSGVYAFVPENIVGPGGSLASQTQSAIQAPLAVTVWDDEVMNDLRGYPASCFTDQFRLGFCDFPSVPGGINWSAINSPTDLYANDASSPSNAIFEIVPDKSRVFYVVPGMESSEFVFCDRKLYYILINATNPLVPGSVGFQILSSDGCAQVQPRAAQEALVYVNAGRNSVVAITAPGAYNRPFNTNNLTEFHSDLFSNVVALAVPTADGTFNERYIYALNSDGSLIVGKYTTQSGEIKGGIGWGPWNGVGAVAWVAAWASDVLFSTSYFGTPICEILDDNQYLDASLPVNSAPAAFAPPGGKGPLWFIPSQTVNLMDQVTRSMGTYQIDANGFIVPQFNGGEDLNAASLIAGQQWTMVAEPFCPDANPGSDVGQRMFKRRISRFAAYVVNSTGFLMARLFSGPITRTSPPLGTVMNTRRVTTWNQDDDPTAPPPLRETAERWRPLGRSFDPRVAIIKDTPGPLLIEELGIEATI